MSRLDRKVLICKSCGSSQVQVKYGEDTRYPEDYSIDCLDCSNWEQGNGVPYTFKVLDEPILKEDINMNMDLTNIVECKVCGSDRVSKCYLEGKKALKCNRCGEYEYHDTGIYNKFLVIQASTSDLRVEEDILVDQLVSRCTEVTMEPMVGMGMFNEEGIDEVVEQLRKTLLSEYEQKRKEQLIEQENRVAYRLVGADISAVLHDIGRRDVTEDPKKLEKVMDYLEHKLEIPWMEYVEAALDMYLWRKDV